MLRPAATRKEFTIMPITRPQAAPTARDGMKMPASLEDSVQAGELCI